MPSPPVAVRSSAVGEDSAEATFAGQQESVLWVRGSDAVCDAVRTCWASLHSPTAVAYRARLGDCARGPDDRRDRAVDGRGGRRRRAVHVQPAQRGSERRRDQRELGTRRRGRRRRGDARRLPRQQGHRRGPARASGHEGGRVRARSAAGPGPRGSRWHRSDATPARLDAAAIAELVDIARAIERHFGAPQDVEWAIGADGLFVLQSRPVTALPERRRAAEPASALSLVMKTFGARG